MRNKRIPQKKVKVNFLLFSDRSSCFPNTDHACDDTQESIFFQPWTFSCSHAVFLMNTTKVQNSQVSPHDLYWKNTTREKRCPF